MPHGLGLYIKVASINPRGPNQQPTCPALRRKPRNHSSCSCFSRRSLFSEVSRQSSRSLSRSSDECLRRGFSRSCPFKAATRTCSCLPKLNLKPECSTSAQDRDQFWRQVRKDSFVFAIAGMANGGVQAGRNFLKGEP